MPTMAFLIKVLSVIMEYGMLLCLLYFVSHSVRYIWRDIQRTGRSLSEKGGALSGGAALTVVGSGDQGQMGKRFAFSEEITIGRSANNDILISDNFVSHHHAVIFLRNNLYVIEDLGSRNHTYVNDRRLNGRAYLKDGDLIRIGFLTLRFER